MFMSESPQGAVVRCECRNVARATRRPLPAIRSLLTLQVDSYFERAISSFLGGDVADPYAIVRCGGDELRTSTIPNTLHPAWVEAGVAREFKYHGTLRQLLSEPLSVHLYDEDELMSSLGLEPSLGHGEVRRDPVIANPISHACILPTTRLC